MTLPRRALGLLAGALALAACASTSGPKVAVIGTDDACTPERTELAAGKTTFVFTNKAAKVSELYVLREDGGVVAEVENVTTGTRRTLVADLSAGTYVLACKPGQAGDGIRTEVTVTGAGGGAAAPAADRTFDVVAKDYSFSGLPATLAKGEAIGFSLRNEGTVEHELEVLAPDGEPLGEVGPTAVGATGTVVLTFDEAGTYTVVCGIEGHEALGMKATVTVS